MKNALLKIYDCLSHKSKSCKVVQFKSERSALHSFILAPFDEARCYFSSVAVAAARWLSDILCKFPDLATASIMTKFRLFVAWKQEISGCLNKKLLG